ncbi:uncharacterized protein MJAP1_001177 [Malassezia japonica]|uniref:Histone-lysine N-methyltransferase SET5 n=1 Tax=Malassezia japonica TaxID=223818 RepID=A0AAF0F4M5_9BASI|nr:uncharacterized protein MJAP1_001177 [Malassezia japonica]WFD38228.1 hypothetical protein MJAP1_001177 [Malassezia japonica]
MSDQSRVPTDEEVVQAARAHYEAPTPTLGIAKLLGALQAEHGWSLSEKRFRKLLQTAGLRQGTQKQPWVPVSSVDESVPLPDGVAAKYFDEVKGRGLVATKPFAEGQSLFVEDAFLAAPPPSQLPRLLSGELCAHCFHPTSGSTLAIACGTGKCGARFCNRICQGRAQSTHHALLCPGLNPNAEPLLKFLEQYQWHSLHNVARALARLLLTESAHPPPSVSPTTGATVHGLPTHDAKASFDETLRHLDAFATVSELERRARNPGWSMEKAMFLPAMRQAWELLCRALDPRQDKLPKRFPVQRTAFPAAALDRVFSYDAFLGMLGRTNINMESHGGLYLVHSYLNHDCEPNLSIKHVPGRGGIRAATRISAQAVRPIAPGDELLISYVDPKLPASRRRELLWRDYCFGPCACARCTAEQPAADGEFDAAAASKLAANTSVDAAQAEQASLEHELRTSLGF